MHAKDLAQSASNYQSELTKYFWRRTRGKNDIRDLAQEVHLRLLAHPSNTDVETPLAYLYGVARNVLAEYRECEEQRRAHVIFDSKELEEQESHAPIFLEDEVADRMNLQQQLDRALQKLTPRQRLVILLHKRDGWTYDEIAAKLRCSCETVSRHMVDARVKLRKFEWER